MNYKVRMYNIQRLGISMDDKTKLGPEPEAFAKDPFGYSMLGWHKWGLAQEQAGFPVNLSKGPTGKDLKSPVLWLSHTQALSTAAIALIQNQPNLESLPEDMRGVAHCQYHAVALMLVGYSLESCLKAMVILRLGVDAYEETEKKHRHHDLRRLAEFIPDLSDREKAVLDGLTHFTKWAGRYPDPGFGNVGHTEAVFGISEKYEVSAKDLFEVAAKVSSYTAVVLSDAASE